MFTQPREVKELGKAIYFTKLTDYEKGQKPKSDVLFTEFPPTVPTNAPLSLQL